MAAISMSEPQRVKDAPIFIFSTMRAGSTLLRAIFDAHPDVWSPPELRLGELCARLYHSTYWSWPAQDGHKARDARGIEEARGYVGGLMEAMTARYGKKIWCEKCPLSVIHLPLLERVFPEARFVWLTRNCVDVAHSCLEITWVADRFIPQLAEYISRDPDRLPAAMARYWVDINRTLLEGERRAPGRWRRVSYEKIIAHPQETLEPLFTGLGLAWSDTLLNACFDSEHRDGPGDFKFRYTRQIHDRSIGKGSRFRRDQFPEDVLLKADTLSRELGYPPIGESSASAGPDEDQASRVDALVKDILPRFSARAPENGLRGQLVVEVGPKRWLADLSSGDWTEAPHKTEADTSVFVQPEDLAAIVRGDANAADLLSEGKLIVAGSLQKAYDFFTLLVSGLSGEKPVNRRSACQEKVERTITAAD